MTPRKPTYLKAVNEALEEELARDQRVVLIGEDLVTWGGPYGACKGLAHRFPKQVYDTPISESAFLGAAVGAATSGLRPIVELMFSDFLGVCLEPLMNSAAKLPFVSGGQISVPIVVRTTIGAGHSMSATHSQTLYAQAAHIPGLTVLAPATVADAKGMLKSAVRSDGPVVIFEHKMLYTRLRDDLAAGEAALAPLVGAAVRRPGTTVTIVAISRAVQTALAAADILAADGIDCEVVDIRAIVPLDLPAIAASVRRTGGLLVIDEATPFCSVGSEIVSQVARHAFPALRTAPRLLAAPHAPIGFSPALDRAAVPSVEAVTRHVREMVNG